MLTLPSLSAAAAAALLLSLVTAVRADFVSTPLPEGAGVSTALRNAARTYQVYYAASQLSSITTTQAITGLEFRLSASDVTVSAGHSWPAEDLTFSDYTIQLSTASTALETAGGYTSGTTTFAQGQGSNLTTVRSGSLQVPEGAFSANETGGQTNEFGFRIGFDTPYQFQPGESIVLTLRLSGYAPVGEPQPFFAAAVSTANQTSAIASNAGAGATSANGLASPLIINFLSSPVSLPEPGAAGLLAAAAASLGLIRRVRVCGSQPGASARRNQHSSGVFKVF